MGNWKALALLGAAAMLTTPAAKAADLMPMMQQVAPPVYDDFASGWYLRGDVGVGIQKYGAFEHTATNGAFVWPASWNVDSRGINDAVFVGAGIGYQFNSWLRFDVTGEYRATSRFKAVGRYSGAADFCAGGGVCFDVYDGHHSAAVFLANAYFDLGTWWRLTPFVGGGVGAAYHSITDFWDLGINSDGTTGRGFAADHSVWNLAWSLQAGVAYNVTRDLQVELAYRYLNMGNVRTGIVDCVGCGVGGPLAYYTLRKLDSHDIKLGLRWMIDSPAPPPPPPLITKG